MFEWKNEYSINIASIDAQHKKLFAIAEDLHEAMRTGQAKPVLSRLLDRLVQYTMTHFAQEEGLMKLHAYPDFLAHKAAHEALTQRVLKFQRMFEDGETYISIDLMTFLQEWLKNHIQGTDMRYSPFLTQRNVA